MTTATPTMRVLGGTQLNGHDIRVDDIPALVEALRPISARERPLLLVTDVDGEAEAQRTLSLARAGAPGARGVVHACALPPLGRSTLFDTVASLGSDAPAGELLCIIEALERAMVTGAVVSSVARLRTPGPTMAQHLRSWLPRSRFVVLTNPVPAVGVVTEARPLGVELPDAPVALVVNCTEGDANTRAVVDAVCERLAGGEPTSAPTPPDSRRRWAAKHFTEFAAAPQDISVLVRTTLDAADACRSCGEPVVWDACRFCHSRRWPDQNDVLPSTPDLATPGSSPLIAAPGER